MSVKLLTEHHLEFLRLKGGCTGSSESTLVKMPHCWKAHVAAHCFSCYNIALNCLKNGLFYHMIRGVILIREIIRNLNLNASQRFSHYLLSVCPEPSEVTTFDEEFITSFIGISTAMHRD